MVINVLTCTQKGEALVASGRRLGRARERRGVPDHRRGVLGERTFGKKTVTVTRGDNEKGRTSWNAEVPLNGDAVGAGGRVHRCPRRAASRLG